MNDQKYWNAFYKKSDKILKEPSPFAIFVKDKIKEEDHILELGCGNGRDTLYLSNFCKKITAIDSSKAAIEQLSRHHSDKISFINMDIMDISNIDCKPTVIYSRFFLHSIDEVAEGKMFDWVSKLPSSTLFCLECRSEKDMELPKYYGKTHYRRGANLKKIVNKLEKNNYKIHFSIESNGLAVYKEEDPFVIRVISEKL